MTYLKFLKLDYLKFKRSPNFSKKLILKILTIIGYLFFAFYMIMLSFLLFYVIKEKTPNADIFQKAHTYLFIYFFIVFYTMMYLSFDSIQVKPFMILPIKKRQIIWHQLVKIILHPVNLVFSLMLLTFMILNYRHAHYSLSGLLAWFFSILLISFVMELILFFSSRNNLLNGIMGLFVFVIIYKMKWLSHHLNFIGDYFYSIYTKPYLIISPIILFTITLLFLYYYISKRFYLDDAIKQPKKKKIRSLNLNWTNKYGLMGSFLQNDIRLILRNARPRQSLIGFVIFYILTFFLYSGHAQQLHQNEFNQILFLFMLTGYFLIQFGNFVPAWDSEYYPLLMTQSISYRQYLEAKWWLMAISVIITLILTLPFLLLGWKVYILIFALAIFNIGVNLPISLLAGAYRQTPLKLNQKVKAFQNTESFNFKIYVFAMLKLFIPIILILIIEKYAGFQYAVLFLLVMGLMGILTKNWLLERLTKLYIRRKYITLEGFKKIEE